MTKKWRDDETRRRPIADQKLLQKVGGGGQKHGMQSGSGPSLEVVRELGRQTADLTVASSKSLASDTQQPCDVLALFKACARMGNVLHKSK